MPTDFDKKLSYHLETGHQATYFFVAKLLSIAVITYSYVYHLRSLCVMIRLLCHNFIKCRPISKILSCYLIKIQYASNMLLQYLAKY